MRLEQEVKVFQRPAGTENLESNSDLKGVTGNLQ